jgi:hypothetical protein
MRNEFLRLVSESEPLLLEPTDGSDVLMNERDLFNYIDPNFEDWGTGEKGPATGECPVEVYEMKAEGTFAQLFGSLSTDPRLLCLTQAQILSFVKVHGLLLRSKTFGTFFLFEFKGNLLIAAIGICPGGTHRARLECAVFAESEVVGLVTRSARREDIARAVHRAVVMLRRNGVAGPVVFDCLRRRWREEPLPRRAGPGGTGGRGVRPRGSADGGRARSGAGWPRGPSRRLNRLSRAPVPRPASHGLAWEAFASRRTCAARCRAHRPGGPPRRGLLEIVRESAAA